MRTVTRHIHSGVLARLLLVGVMVFGQCGLMAAHAFAHTLTMDRHGHDHMAPGAMDEAVVAPHAAMQADACCVDTPALLAKGVTLDKPPVAVVSGGVPAPLAASAPEPVTPSRGPPPRPFAARRHVLLQTFLI
ncbi:MAG: hypothetical protein HZA24_10420 [Nitrospirae bacterium]|nr:hypothetical protein [Nitrospirota bacterium]